MFIRSVVFTFTCISLSGQVLITELMYDLPGTDSPNEFVELFNPSETDSVDLRGWRIRDRYSTDALVDSGYGLTLPPGGYALILEGDYSPATGIYAPLLPEGTVLIKVDDASIGNGLAGSDSLYLIDSTGTVVDSLGWSDVAPDGYSLEKVRLFHPNRPANWRASRDSLGTPGRPNSVLPLAVDGELLPDRLFLNPTVLAPGETTLLQLAVTNSGLEPFTSTVEVQFQETVILTHSLPVMEELDTVELVLEVGPFPSGYDTLDLVLHVAGDLNNENNSGEVTVGVRFPPGILTLNEFLPKPGDGQSEFVELVHIGTAPVQLADWQIRDNRTGTDFRLRSHLVQPGEFLVIAPDSTLLSVLPARTPLLVPAGGFPSLNNSGDEIHLLDPFRTPHDSLTYTSEWGLFTGVSLEKRFPHLPSADPDHWEPAVAPSGMTPGAVNSITPLELNGALIPHSIRFDPPFPTPDETSTVTVPVVNLGVTPLTAPVICRYESAELGRADVASLMLAETTTVVISLPPFPSGIHPLQFQLELPGDLDPADNETWDTLRVSYPFGVVRLNEFMARPNNDQTEFVELVSLIEVPLVGWSISDNSLSRRRIPETVLHPGDYLVLAADSAIIAALNPSARVRIPRGGFPALNNAGDAIYLYDHTGTPIDTLHYDAAWPVVPEQSTEKLRPEFPSAVAANWGVTTAASGSTPGTSNAIALFDVDGALAGDSLFHEPRYPTADQVLTLYVPVRNAGVSTIAGNLTVEEADEEIADGEVPELPAGDMMVVSITVPPLAPGRHVLTVALQVPGDLNPDNNLAVDTVQVSYPFAAVVLNEFLAVPDTHQTEFIELISFSTLDLSGWGIGDATGVIRRLPPLIAPANTPVVIAADSSLLLDNGNRFPGTVPLDGFPSLNNQQDALFLYDPTGTVIDSLRYDDSWPLRFGRSTEKFQPEYPSADPIRWAVAVNPAGMTPGAVNSVYFTALPERGSIDYSPNPFSPDGDGIDDVLIIQYNLPFEQAVAKLEIFDMVGRKIAAPIWNVHLPQAGVLTWDGKRSNGETARIGIYIVRFRAKDPLTGKTWENVQTVVLAKRL
jgi:hypothetical protein